MMNKDNPSEQEINNVYFVKVLLHVVTPQLSLISSIITAVKTKIEH